MSDKSFDNQFDNISFYQIHPFMRPFVGDNYRSSKHKKLLIVGENHYMPPKSTFHHNANDWYNQPALSNEEEGYCNTKIACEKLKNLFVQKINDFLKGFYKGPKNVLQEIAFCNFYLRPADYEQNMKNLWKKFNGSKIDKEYALKVFPKILDVLQPDVIVFCGQIVWNCVAPYLHKEMCGDLENVAHCYSPSRNAWHRSKREGCLSESELRIWLLKKWLY